MTPLKNAPRYPFLLDSSVLLAPLAKPGIGNSQTPKKLNARVNMNPVKRTWVVVFPKSAPHSKARPVIQRSPKLVAPKPNSTAIIPSE